jgi:oligopeptide transport system substrate-binding protein
MKQQQANHPRLFFCIAALVMFLGGCTSMPSNSEEEGKTVFRYNEIGGVSTLDPAFSRTVETNRACEHLYNSLLELDKQLGVKPSIAKDWEVSEDGKVYTFFLRSDVYFHDDVAFPNGKGRKVEASDFVYSFQRILDSNLSSPGAWIFNLVQTLEVNGKKGFEAMDKKTLVIRLKEPFAPFLGLLTMKYCSVVPHEAIRRYGEEFRSHPVGTGPFQFKLWSEGAKLVLVKNPRYFEKDIDGKSLPYLDAIAIRFIQDEDVEYQEFLLGNLDVISGTNASNNEFLTNVGALKAKYRGQFNKMTAAYLNTEYLGISLEAHFDTIANNPWMNRAFRKALNYGFSRKNMIRYLKNNIGTPAHAGFVPNGFPILTDTLVKGYTYQPDSTRKLLREAGFPDGEGLPLLKLHTTPQYRVLCEYLQHQWSEFGIPIKLEINPPATNRELVAQSKAQFFRKSWVADYPDPENYLALFYSKNFTPNGPNYTHFKNTTFDALYEQSIEEKRERERYELYRKMDQLIMDEAPVVVLYYDQVVRYVQPNIISLGVNPINIFDLRRVEKFNER